MGGKFYFSNEVNETTWEKFVMAFNRLALEEYFELISGYGWRDTFSFKPNGEAIYITNERVVHKGIWFDLNGIKIGIFEKGLKDIKFEIENTPENNSESTTEAKLKFNIDFCDSVVEKAFYSYKDELVALGMPEEKALEWLTDMYHCVGAEYGN